MGIGTLLIVNPLQGAHLGVGSSMALHHPGLKPAERPAGARRGQRKGAAGGLLHSQMGQQAGLAITKPKRAQTKLRARPQQDFGDHGGGVGTTGTLDLEQLETRPLLEDQQNPPRDQTFGLAGITDQLQGLGGSADPQTHNRGLNALIELDQPMLLGVVGMKSPAQQGLNGFGAQSAHPGGQCDPSQGIGCHRELRMDRRQGGQIGEAPVFESPAGHGSPGQALQPSCRTGHRSRYSRSREHQGTSTGCRANSASTQSYPVRSSSSASSLPPLRRMRPAAITWTKSGVIKSSRRW